MSTHVRSPIYGISVLQETYWVPEVPISAEIFITFLQQCNKFDNP